jgi:ribosomal protein S18 acetylase RimI-like enzyme
VTVRARAAQLADYEPMCALWRVMDDLHAQLLPTYFRRPPGPPRTRAEVERILRSPDEVLRVAEDGEAGIVGLCHALLYDTPPVPAMTPCRRVHVDSLVVLAPWQRRGVGRLLVDEAEAWARARNAAEVVLTVWAGNTGAAEFYGALGFEPVNAVLGKRLA